MVEVVFVPVAFVQTMLESVEGERTFKLVKVAFVAVRFVKAPLVAKALVAVVLVKTLLVAKRFAPVAFVKRRLVTEPFVAAKFVAKRLVEVVLVPVAFVQTSEAVVAFVITTSPKLPFQRNEGVPMLYARSVVGVRLEETVPETVSVVVTTAFEVFKPPSKLRVAVATEPRFVTERRVSASAG